MSDTIHSPKRLLVEAARRELRSLNENLTTEITEQGKCRVRYEAEVEAGAETAKRKEQYLGQMNNYNALITELKRKRDAWEQALSHTLDLLET